MIPNLSHRLHLPNCHTILLSIEQEHAVVWIAQMRTVEFDDPRSIFMIAVQLEY